MRWMTWRATSTRHSFKVEIEDFGKTDGGTKANPWSHIVVGSCSSCLSRNRMPFKSNK